MAVAGLRLKEVNVDREGIAELLREINELAEGTWRGWRRLGMISVRARFANRGE